MPTTISLRDKLRFSLKRLDHQLQNLFHKART